MYVCPKCQRESSEEGFCPFDGSTLSAKNSDTKADAKGPEKGLDDLSTQPHLSTGTLTGSAVASVLKGVLEDRNTGTQSLVGAELDGRYRIEKLIGEGGMGMVYLARHIVIEKKVAIKVLRAEVAVDEAVAKRFVQEARAASRIGHPNIVDVTDFGTTKAGLTYQVMEYLEGQTLTELIQKVQPLPLARALGVVAQMARALGAAHDKGIVHRDLKPDNIFLVKRDGREDFVKIVDFGIAKVTPKGDSTEARLTQVGTVFGTPEYMSPEQASGRTDVDLRADVYAIGTILYEMLVGKVPHKGETTVRTLAMQILDDAPRPKEARPDLEISQDLEDVVMRALEKNREKRFQTMQELLDALEDVTSKTELDLPLLLKQERNSANQVRQNQFDTVPEVDGQGVPLAGSDLEVDEEEDADNAVTSVRDVERAGRTTGGQRSRRSSRVTDPVFLRRGSSASVPIFDPDEPEETEPIRESKSKLGIVLLALLLMAGAVGAFVLTRDTGKEAPIAATPLDAGAAPLLETKSDAAAPIPMIDAGSLAADAGTGKPTGKKPRNNTNVAIKRPQTDTTVPLGEGILEVTVITKPRGGRLIIKNEYAGSDGLNLHRKMGDIQTVRCKLNGYQDGTVVIKFDGKQELFLCKMRKVRTKRCVEGVKNPFYDCP